MRPRVGADSAVAQQSASRCPELDCVRHRLPAGAIAAAERRACAIGVTAERVLITSGLLTEETYMRALAQSLGMAFEPLETPPREACPVNDERLILASAAGLIPLMIREGELALVVAPRGVAARRLCTAANGSPELRRRIRLTTAERLARFVDRNAAAPLGRRAAFGLLTRRPDLSAAPREETWPQIGLFAAAVAAFAARIAAPELMATGLGVFFSLVFIAWIALRLLGLMAAAPPPPPLPRRPDACLPAYTVIVALYREAAAVEQLIASLDALDWPGIRAQTPQAG